MKRMMVMFIITVLTSAGCGHISAAATGGNQLNQAAETESEGTEADNDDDTLYSQEVFAMDTFMTLTAYGSNAKKAVEQSVAEIKVLDETLSTGSDASEIGRINKNGSGTISADTEYLINRGIEIGKSTQGAFDLCIYPIMKEWGFTTKEYKVPEDEKIKQLLPLIDMDQLSISSDGNTVTLQKPSMGIDLGGIAKGFTSTKIMEIYKKNGIKSGLVSLGGNVQVLGRKNSGDLWKVAIEHPQKEGEYLGVLKAENTAVVTSGGYERYFEENGVRYHHIIDPATGYPAQSGLLSVTIVTNDGTLADALSTALFVMGEEKAVEYWKQHSKAFDFILATEDQRLVVTEGIAKLFEGTEETSVVKK